jgi:hypothetical protein
VRAALSAGDEITALLDRRTGYVLMRGDRAATVVDIDPALEELLRTAARRGDVVRRIEIVAGGGWIVLHGDAGWQTYFAPEGVDELLQEAAASGERIVDIAYLSNNSTIVLLESGRLLNQGRVPADFQTTLEELQDHAAGVERMAFGPGESWVLLLEDGSWRQRGIPAAMETALQEVAARSGRITMISFTASGGWIVLEHGAAQ